MCGVGEYKWRGKILGDFFYGKRVEKDNKKNRKGMKKEAVCVCFGNIFSHLNYGMGNREPKHKRMIPSIT